MPGNVAFVPITVGFIQSVTIADPGKQVEFSYTFPNNYVYKVDLLYFLFDTDSNFGNRYPVICLADNLGALRGRWAENRYTPPNTIDNFTIAKNFQQITKTASNVMIPFPDAWILPGWELLSSTVAFQSGDEYKNIRLTYTRYREQF